MNILVTVCARAGSKGVRNKNIRLLNGKPLIAYTLEHAACWGRAARCVVSTDSEEIAAIARSYRGEVPFIRPKELATDTTPKFLVIQHALKESEGIFGEKYDIVVDLDVTSPLRRVTDIEQCYQKFIAKKPFSLFSVVPSQRNPYFNMVEEKENEFVKLCKDLPGGVFRRQDAPKVYDMNASIYFYQRSYLLDPLAQGPISEKTAVHVMDEISAFDIDHECHFGYVEFLLKEGIFQS